MLQKIKNDLLLRLLLLGLTGYAIHKFVFRLLFPEVPEVFIYSLEELYLFFGLASFFICALLLFIRRKELNNVGFSFLFITVVKMAAALFFIQPILKTQASHQSIEKYSFFAIFLVFLTIETITTITILNKKE